MEVNKVEFGGKTLIDLTEDTVSEENLLQGATAHDARGRAIVGGAEIPEKLSQLENDVSYRPVIHITKEEYDALPEDKLTNGVVYLVEDMPPSGPTIDESSVMKREIMASYGYYGIEWNLDELMKLVQEDQFDKFAIGDYFVDITETNEKVIWEIAGKNFYLYYGNSTKLYSPHIVCCPRNCLATSYQYNTENTATGGYYGSLMPENLETEANKFSDKLQNYMVEIERMFDNNGSWSWKYSRIFLPSVYEIFGHNAFAGTFSVGAPCQLPLFIGGRVHIMKGITSSSNERYKVTYWLGNPRSTGNTFCCAASNGIAYYYDAKDKLYVAPFIVLA